MNQPFYIIFQGEKVKIFSQIPRVQLELADISSLYLFFGDLQHQGTPSRFKHIPQKKVAETYQTGNKTPENVYEKSNLTTININI